MTIPDCGLYIIGLGLADEKDITLKGLEYVKAADIVYLEAYTSMLTVPIAQLEELYGKKVTVAEREFVEQASEILECAKNSKVAFLVVGDPYGATTHSDLELRARSMGIPVKVVHNASVMNAIGACGLQLYNYGPTISIVFFTETYKPDSFYDKLKQNKQQGWHTLCLLDIKMKEPNLDMLAHGKVVYEPPRFMTVNQAIEQLLEIESMRKEGVISENSKGVGIARLGAEDQVIRFGTFKQLLSVDFGKPLHCFIVPGEMHFLEEEIMSQYELKE